MKEGGKAGKKERWREGRMEERKRGDTDEMEM